MESNQERIFIPFISISLAYFTSYYDLELDDRRA